MNIIKQKNTNSLKNIILKIGTQVDKTGLNLNNWQEIKS